MAQLPASKKTGIQFRKVCISIPFLNSNAVTLTRHFIGSSGKMKKVAPHVKATWRGSIYWRNLAMGAALGG
jgi:hypothetical protein